MGRFDGGETSDGDGVLLREVEHRTRILGRLRCFTDYRDVDRIEHSVEALIKHGSWGCAWATTITTSCAGICV